MLARRISLVSPVSGSDAVTRLVLARNGLRDFVFGTNVCVISFTLQEYACK
jgi:hypothetical protein